MKVAISIVQLIFIVFDQLGHVLSQPMYLLLRTSPQNVIGWHNACRALEFEFYFRGCLSHANLMLQLIVATWPMQHNNVCRKGFCQLDDGNVLFCFATTDGNGQVISYCMQSTFIVNLVICIIDSSLGDRYDLPSHFLSNLRVAHQYTPHWAHVWRALHTPTRPWRCCQCWRSTSSRHAPDSVATPPKLHMW